MFCVHVGKDKFRAVEKELQSRGYEWANKATKFNPFNYTDRDKVWVQAWGDMDITWSEEGQIDGEENGEVLTLDELLGKEMGKTVIELEALNYIKENELSVTIKFEYCEGELDLVEITTDSETYLVHRYLNKTVKVLEAIQLLESL